MNLRKRVRVVAMALVGLAVARGAQAQATFQTTGNNTAWRNSASWTYLGVPAHKYPTTLDTVVVRHNLVISNAETVSSLTVNGGSAPVITFSAGSLSSGSLTVTGNSSLVLAGCGPWTTSALAVNSGSFLGIGVNNSLTLGDGGSGTIHGLMDIDGGAFVVSSWAQATIGSGGVIFMAGPTPTMTVNAPDGLLLDSSGKASIMVDSDYSVEGAAVINGSGSVKGMESGDAILINICQGGSLAKLKLDGVTVHGTLTIMDGGSGGQAGFENQGYVVADSDDGLYLDWSLYSIADSSSSCTNARWQVTSGSALGIGVTATSLASPFTVNGLLCLDSGVTVTTSGGLSLGPSGSVGCGGTFNHGTCP